MHAPHCEPTFGTCTVQAACGMAATEAATVVTLYVLLDPNALVLRARGLRYRFRSSLEDVVAFSLVRCVAVLLAYGFGAGRKYQRCAARPQWSPHAVLRPQLAAAVVPGYVGIEAYLSNPRLHCQQQKALTPRTHHVIALGAFS